MEKIKKLNNKFMAKIINPFLKIKLLDCTKTKKKGVYIVRTKKLKSKK